MFFLNRNLPTVTEKILLNLGPRDLVGAKLVNKEWHSNIKSYINHHKSNDCLKRSILTKAFYEVDQVSCFATIKLPYKGRALTVNSSDEVYILGNEALLQIDINNLNIKAEIPFAQTYVENWKSYGRLSNSKKYKFNGTEHTEISVSPDKSELQVKQFVAMSSYESASKYFYDIKDSKLYLKDTCRLSNIEMNWTAPSWAKHPGPVPSPESVAKFSRKFGLNVPERYLSDIAWLQDGNLALYSVSTPLPMSGAPWSRIFAIRYVDRDALKGGPQVV